MKQSNDMAYFSVDLLFSESLDFGLEEIAQAVSEDFPEAAVCVHPVNAGKTISTNQPVLGMLKPIDARNGYVILLNGLGAPDEEFRKADNTEIAMHSGSFAHCAINAIKSHQSYFTLSVQTQDRTVEGYFRAVRQLMAVSAVFAQLPICLGVLAHWSSHMVAPGIWVEATKKSLRGKCPVYEWISFRCGWEEGKNGPNSRSVGFTKGLRSFVGFEVHLAAAPVSPSEAKILLRRACSTLLRGGVIPHDGALFHIDNDPIKYKVRRPTNARGIPDSVMVLLHPDIRERHKNDKTRIRTRQLTECTSHQKHYQNVMEALLGQKAAVG